MSTFDTKGPLSKMQLDLFYDTLHLSIFLFILVGGMLLYALVTFREKPEDRDKPPPPDPGHGNPLIEIGGIVFSIICLVFIAIPTVQGIWMMEELPDYAEDGNYIEIKVTGNQWWWSFDYDIDGKRFSTANEIVLPVGKVAKLNLRSNDVIHSFWLPKIAGKVDMVPGRTNWMWIQADEIGHYYGQCAEYCGEAHAYMLIRADVVSQEDFDHWVDQQVTPPPAPNNKDWASFMDTLANLESNPQKQLVLDDPVQNGARLFLTKGTCASCHTLEGVPGATGVIGPNLTYLADRKSIGAGIMENRNPQTGLIDEKKQFQNILDWISNSQHYKAGNLMHSRLQDPAARKVDKETKKMILSDKEFNDIAKFLQTLKMRSK